jgi:hypothetical protein
MNKKGENILIYLKEKGAPWRFEQLNSQLKPKDKYPLVELKDRSLYDLIPGKIYVINMETLEIEAIYKNQSPAEWIMKEFKSKFWRIGGIIFRATTLFSWQ